MSPFAEAFELEEIGPNTFKGKKPLLKPRPQSRGVYGGNLAAQAILAAMKTIPEGFHPHSFHSLFIKNCSDEIPMTWEIERVSTGRNFCCRTVSGVQDNMVKYLVDISFTKKNSLKQAEIEHQRYLERRQAKAAKNGGKYDDADEEEDDDLVQKPFYFLTPYPDWLKNVDKSRMEYLDHTELGEDRFIEHLIPRQLSSLEGTEDEESIPAAKRKLAFFVRLGRGDLKLEDRKLQYAGLAVLTDSLFLTKLARLLRIGTVDLVKGHHYFSVSLDHTIYFHDTDFDCTEWMAFGFKAMRLFNNRVLLEAEMYNTAGQHVATIIQEGLVHLNGLEEHAKL